jgi:hypothetical protein
MMNNQMSEQGRIVPSVKRDPKQGNWFPASGGTETVFTTRTGRRLLYCWQPTTGRHAYLDYQTDIILSDQEAEETLQLS